MQKNIDFGSFPNDPDADAIRTAFSKVQQNFTELYTSVQSGGVTKITPGTGIQVSAPTGEVTITAKIACVQVTSTSLNLSNGSTPSSYVIISSSTQPLGIELPNTIDTVSNIILSGSLEASGNITTTAGYFLGDGGLLSNITIPVVDATQIVNGTSNVKVEENANVTVSISGTSNIVTFYNSGVIFGNGIGGNISNADYISANFFVGDGSYLTNISVGAGTQIINGDSNVTVTANSNVNTSVNGVANVFVVTSVGANILGDLDTTGNVTANNGVFTGNLYANVEGFAIGYRDVPQLPLTINTTISLSDAGKHYYSISGSDLTLLIANNASQPFLLGAAIAVVNQGTGNITIGQDTGVTLYFAGNATSGNRTITSYGMATIMKVATDTWFIVGGGII